MENLEDKIKDFKFFAIKCLTNLYDITINKLIWYYLEVSQELDKVLDIFIRINSGGTQLSNSDLLLSTSTAKWKDLNARNEITSLVDDLNNIGEKFNFDKDFLLKSSLVLSDLPNIAYRVNNFNTKNMEEIEKNWIKIKFSIKMAVELVSSFGYNFQNLTSNNALIPIAYYIHKKERPQNFVDDMTYFNDRNLIRDWLNHSLIKRVFSGQPDNVLRPIRKIIKENSESFPLKKIVEFFRGTNKSFIFSDDDIEGLLSSKYGQKHTFAILSLLYPDLDYTKKFHQDHIFPRAFFKKRELKKRGLSNDDVKFFMENYNFIGNLQLLKGIKNEMKGSMDFLKWVEEQFPNENKRKEYFNDNYIVTDCPLEFINFRELFNKRNKLLVESFKKVLTIFDDKDIVTEEKIQVSEQIEQEPSELKQEILEKYQVKRKFVYAEIRRIISKYSERNAREALEYCNYILTNKIKFLCHSLEAVLNKRARKKIILDMIEEVKKSDKEMKDIELNIPEEELKFNYSRIWHIVKDILSESLITADATNYLRNYLETWLEIQVSNAVKKMNLRNPYRKTLKARDFE